MFRRHSVLARLNPSCVIFTKNHVRNWSAQRFWVFLPFAIHQFFAIWSSLLALTYYILFFIHYFCFGSQKYSKADATLNQISMDEEPWIGRRPIIRGHVRNRPGVPRWIRLSTVVEGMMGQRDHYLIRLYRGIFLYYWEYRQTNSDAQWPNNETLSGINFGIVGKILTSWSGSEARPKMNVNPSQISVEILDVWCQDSRNRPGRLNWLRPCDTACDLKSCGQFSPLI